MQKEQRQILQLIEGKIGDNEQFAYECRIKEIEWNMAKELKIIDVLFIFHRKKLLKKVD